MFLAYFMCGCILLILLLLNIFYENKSISAFISITQYFILFAFLFHFIALGVRWYISGHAPWSNAYESVIFIAFATMMAGVSFSKKSNFALAASCLVSSMLLVVANLNWLNPEITNLVPVLKSYWLMIHVSIITYSYGFLALSAFLGLLTLFLIIFIGKSNFSRSVFKIETSEGLSNVGYPLSDL